MFVLLCHRYELSIMTNTLKVGITGGIGSGKTTVTKLFNLLGISVYDADTEAKKLMESDADLIDSIKRAFGSGSYIGSKLDRQFLAKTVFTDETKLEKLNGLVHPAVGRNFEQWAAKSTEPYIIKEAALLFESRSYTELDFVILVTSPLDIRIARIKRRDPERSNSQIRNIIDKQINVEEAVKLADRIVNNDEETLLIPQVLKLHQF